jgi:hypothetical protein
MEVITAIASIDVSYQATFDLILKLDQAANSVKLPAVQKQIVGLRDYL